MVIEILIFAHYKQDLKIIVKTELFDYISNRVFFELGENRLLYPIVFFLKNLNPVEYNYEIYDKNY